MCSRVFGDTKIWGCPAKNGKPSSEDALSSHSSFKGRPTLKMLELSNSMHPQYVSFQILLALNSSAYNGLSCHGLNFVTPDDEDNGNGNGNDNEDNPSEEETPLALSYIKHMKILIHSRKWLRLEFHRCLGVESLLWMPAETETETNANDGEDCGDIDADVSSGIHENPVQQPRVAAATEVDFLLLKFRKCSWLGLYDEKRHADFFVNLWNHWKVRKLSLSMDFTPEWTREFCRRKVSMLEGLEIHPECTWHRRPPVQETQSNDDNNDEKTNDNSGNHNATSDGEMIEDIDCWEVFCRELRSNHPQLKSLEIRCKTRDEELAYLIDHAIAPAAVADVDVDSQLPTSVLPIEKIVFGKWCSCDELSLLALSRVLTASSSAARRWKVLTLSRGVKLPSRAALDAGNLLPKRDDDRLCLLQFCRALQHARSLTHLELGDYLLDETEMGALFESLVLASGNIERLSLFACAAISQDVYEKVLCGSGANHIESQQQKPQESNLKSPSSFLSCLTQNRLPSLRLLYLPKEASNALCEVLKSNTSIEWINNQGRTKTQEYYLDLNRGGRHILTAMPYSEREIERDSATPMSASTSLLPSLWPKVLERASSDIQSVLGVRKNRYCGGKNRKYDVVYCLLRNQILLQS